MTVPKSATFKTAMWPVDRPQPYPENPRQISQAAIEKTAASIREFGWRQPIVVDENDIIIVGHTRLLAAKLIGVAKVPVHVAEGLTDAQIKAYRLADNRTGEESQWDQTLLSGEVSALGEFGFDLDLTGFDATEITEIQNSGTASDVDPDAVPDEPEIPVSELGDVWLLGKHRVLCGDSTKAEDVDLVMGGMAVDLCFTSPPYAQQRDYDSAITDWGALMRGVFALLPTKPAAQVLVNLGLVHRDGEWMPYWDGWIAWMREQGWRRFGWYVWDQGPGLPGDWNGRLAPSHEFVFHFNTNSKRARKTKAKLPANIAYGKMGSLRRADGTFGVVSSPGKGLQPTKVPDSVIRVMRHKGGGKHPAVFPVELSKEVITAYSDPSAFVYDPFLGSGTTVIAAEVEGRVGFGLEISPAYVDMAVLRWEKFTGETATLEATGQTFAAVAKARAKAAKTGPH